MVRRTSHLAALGLLALSIIGWDFPAVHAAEPSPTPANTPNVHITELSRTIVTTRDPLPTPVAIDPNTTPLPTPYPTPVAVNPDAT